VRVLDALIYFDCVREHAFNTIDPGDHVARSGWVFFDRSVSICWLAVTALPSMTRQAVGEVEVDGVGEEVSHALQEDDAVGERHRVA
jgi:hypothetical protein